MPLVLLLILFIGSTSAYASMVSCPDKMADVSVDEGRPTVIVTNGHTAFFPNEVAPDVGGDYDENSPTIEWNILNYDTNAVPVVVHCFPQAESKESFDIVVPYEIKRCVFTKKEGRMECKNRF